MTVAVSATPSAPSRIAVIINLLLVYVIWGSTYLAIRFVVVVVPPFLSLGLRFVVAGLLLAIFTRLAKAPRPRFVEVRAGAIVGILLVCCGNGLVGWAESHGVPSSLAALLVSMSPIWMALIDQVRPNGTRQTAGSLIGLAIGFVGVALLIGPNLLQDVQHGGISWGVLVIPIGSLCWATGSIYSRTAPMPASSMVGTSIEMIAGGAVMLVVALVLGEYGRVHFDAITPGALTAWVYLVFIGSLVGYSAYTWLLANVPLGLASTYAYVNPVVAVFLGWALASEPITPLTLLGATVIVTSVALITTFRPNPTKSMAGELTGEAV